MEDATRVALELYVEKAAEIEGSPFVARIEEHGYGVTYSFRPQEQELEIEKNHPDVYAFNSIVTPLRFFVQPRDKIDFDSLPKTFSDPALSEGFRKEIAKAPAAYNNFMNASMYAAIEMNGSRITRKEIFETFLYGHFAHANDDKRAKYRLWKSTPAFAILEQNFLDTVVYVLKLNAVGKRLCEQELARAAVERHGQSQT